VLGHRVVTYARHFIGIPYSWGGSSPRTGFDCSGLVRFVYGHFGIRLPHSSWADLSHGHRVGRRFLRAGDLVFFYGASHVGIYVGGQAKGTVGPGDYFGEIALINESPRTATLTARTDMRCYGMTPWDFRPLVETNSTIAWKLLTAMAEKMR